MWVLLGKVVLAPYIECVDTWAVIMVIMQYNVTCLKIRDLILGSICFRNSVVRNASIMMFKKGSFAVGEKLYLVASNLKVREMIV